MQKRLLIVALFAAVGTAVLAGSLIEDRQYEPVVLYGGVLSQFYNVPINEIYLYAYDPAAQKLKVIPFQIDEKILAQDIFSPTRTRHYYANPEAWVMGKKQAILDDGLLDADDELVFLVRDLGPEAPKEAWNGVDVKDGLRRTLAVRDPNRRDQVAFAYLVRSSEKKEIPAPYRFSYDITNDAVENVVYSVRMTRPSGLIEDIRFFPPYGSGVDIFDTQKIRLIGLVDLGMISLTPGLNDLPALNDRENFYVFAPQDPEQGYLNVTPNPVVRLTREVRQTIRLGELTLNDVAFYVKTKFYPFSGSLEGGGSLDPKKLRELFPDPDDIAINFDLVRQSWDFNENAVGMKFYNPNNNGVLVDGNPDAGVNRTLNSKGMIREWMMLSGEQGTFFSYLVIEDTTYKKLELYWHDNRNGGQDDQSYVEGGDTGDGKSYGDHGLKILNSQSLELGFIAYFVEKNKDRAFAEQLAYNVENPVIANWYPVEVSNASDQPPETLRLLQNYPNPFNQATRIDYALKESGRVTLDILNLKGQCLARLVDEEQTFGDHSAEWDGRDDQGSGVGSGIYLYRLKQGQWMVTKKMLLVK
ncbi:MAG: T9SS type A sorting domain-containing protein [candidate division KSB1 bacterium]|nr:T9SS type A sorting domain-containing protein [candidate division KSB1 bacterium]